MKKKVVIASQNPVKINAVKAGFKKMFPDIQFEYEGISVPSNVPDQPKDNSTTLTGAENRAKNSSLKVKEADFWVGIEGGIQMVEDEMEAFAWIVIKSYEGTGKAKTGTFFLPKEVKILINKGKELGEADDIVFGHTKSKQKLGAVGLLTGNVVNRTDLYSQAVVLALIPFKNPGHY